MRNKEVVKKLVALLNKKDWERAKVLIGDEIVRNSSTLGGTIKLRTEEFISFHKDEYKTFPDGHEEINFLIEESSRVVCHSTYTGTQKGQLGDYNASNKKLCANLITIYEIRDKKVVQIWTEWDRLGSLQQLGHIK